MFKKLLSKMPDRCAMLVMLEEAFDTPDFQFEVSQSCILTLPKLRRRPTNWRTGATYSSAVRLLPGQSNEKTPATDNAASHHTRKACRVEASYRFEHP